MLKSFRGVMAGGGRYVLAVVIILAFGLVGVPALENFGGSSAIQVGSQSVSSRDLELELRSQIARVQQENPNVTREQALAGGIGQNAIQTLVVRALIEDEAERLGLTAPPSVLQDYIRQLDALKDPETGEFDERRLGLVLQSQGLSVQGFRDLLQAELLRQQIVEALTGTPPSSEDLTRYLLLRQIEERDVAYALIPAEAASREPTEEEIEAAYQENIDRYQSPEYRTLTVLEITEEDANEGIELSEDELQQLYNARQGQLSAAETRTVRQVVVPRARVDRLEGVAEDASLEEIAEAAGVEVSRLADQTRGDFINSDVAEAIFSAETDTRIGPVENGFGVTYAEVTAINTREAPSFEDLREELEADLRSEIAEERLIELVEAVESARDEGAALAEAAEAVGLEARTVGPLDRQLFTQFGAIADVPSALGQTAFTLEEGEESSSVRLENGYGFVTVEAVTPPAPLPLTEVRDQVVSGVKADAASGAAAEIKAQLQAALGSGEDFAAAVTGLGGEVTTATLTPAAADAAPREVAQSGFSLNIGEVETVTPQSADGIYALTVSSVRFPGSQAIQQAAPVVAQQFGQQVGGELNEAFLQALEEQTQIKQNPRQISRALGQDEG
ncbi:SurA N-terminal domain-containing protein [Parvularcula maris]|uniref:Peptidylprolyl isomerase n=1 Tax=Parvularcula maris TaxID=2965077 RepID=A0A9X2RK28_9PROT|nr:peptidyl-prolyl cis-trans isomerase [Parvularcula maris]MCQ8185177.1 peptidylprolyl isomerase [Parvularcula maris]